MKTTPENPPAFPTHNGLDFDNKPHGGMTLRDYFAGLAMQSVMSAVFAGHCQHKNGGILCPSEYAKAAYENADAMLAARQPQPGEG